MYELTDFLFPLACSLTIVGINDVAIPVAKAVIIAHIKSFFIVPVASL